jgi:hypothetical protein
MEGESGGVTEGRRGFQGEPLLGLPLGRVIMCSVRLAGGTNDTRCKRVAGTTATQRKRAESSLCCEGRSPADSRRGPITNITSQPFKNRFKGRMGCVNAPLPRSKWQLNTREGGSLRHEPITWLRVASACACSRPCHEDPTNTPSGDI